MNMILTSRTQLYFKEIKGGEVFRHLSTNTFWFRIVGGQNYNAASIESGALHSFNETDQVERIEGKFVEN